MKRFSFRVNAKALTMAMLAVALVLGLALVSCGGGTPAPKTMQGLFDELKGFNVGNLYAYTTGIDEDINWCGYHKAWEPWENNVGLVHGGTPAFDFAAATVLRGSYSTSNLYDANSMVIRDIIKTLDSYFEAQYKTGVTETSNWGSSTQSYDLIYYNFYLYRTGAGGYAASADPVRREAGVPFTFTVDRYQF